MLSQSSGGPPSKAMADGPSTMKRHHCRSVRATCLTKAKLPWFNRGHHIRAWKFHRVRPAKGAADPTATDARYCVYDRAHNDYLYTEAWVAKLIRELGEHPEDYPQIVGHTPTAEAA